MKPAPFKYLAPTSINEALEHLSEYGYEAKVLAGGQSLIPAMNFRLSQPSVLIDLNRIEELAYLHRKKSRELVIGAMTRDSHLGDHPLVREHAPLIYETMPFIAHPQIRNRATIGGSIAHADPAAELPAIMVALEARFHLYNQNSDRWVDANDFFTGMFATALEADELLTEIEIPVLPKNTGWAFREIARRHGDYALVGVAAIVALDKKQRCKRAKIVFLSVGQGPVEAHEAVKILNGQQITEEAVQEAAEVAATKDIEPENDLHASAEYRRHLARVLTKDVLTRAAGRAES